VRNLKFDLKEVAGSLGDLATFLPLAIGLITVNGIDVGVQHARLVRDIIGSPRESSVALCIGLVTLATGNLAVSFAAGIALEGVISRFFPEATVSGEAQARLQ
jgi:hypothetical protein